MTMTDAQAARQWVEAWVEEPTNHLLAAVYRHILATTTPPTMGDVVWDDEVHAGLCAEDSHHGLVRMLAADLEGGIWCMTEDGERTWARPRSLTPIPGTRLDLTPRREPAAPDRPTILSSVEDYDNAPTGTVIAYADDVAVKRDDGRWYWSGQSGTSWAEDLADADPCTVVRWGK